MYTCHWVWLTHSFRLDEIDTFCMWTKDWSWNLAVFSSKHFRNNSIRRITVFSRFMLLRSLLYSSLLIVAVISTIVSLRLDYFESCCCSGRSFAIAALELIITVNNIWLDCRIRPLLLCRRSITYRRGIRVITNQLVLVVRFVVLIIALLVVITKE